MITREEVINSVTWTNLSKHFNELDKSIDVNPGDHVIDCGAHFGDITLYLMLRAGELGKVYGIEADSYNYSILKNWVDNLNIGKYITPINLAISNKKGTIRLYKSDTHTTRHSIFKNLMEDRNNYEEVKSDTLDNIVERYRIKKLDFIYMNMEGAEYLAFEGMTNILDKFKPRFCIAEHKNEIFKEKIPEILKNYGYKTKIINDKVKDRIVIAEI